MYVGPLRVGERWGLASGGSAVLSSVGHKVCAAGAGVWLGSMVAGSYKSALAAAAGCASALIVLLGSLRRARRGR